MHVNLLKFTVHLDELLKLTTPLSIDKDLFINGN